MNRRRWILFTFVLALAGLAYYFYGGSEAPAGQGPLFSVNSENFEQLVHDFNEARGAVRVITLLSPT
jgi:hypothetical protein